MCVRENKEKQADAAFLWRWFHIQTGTGPLDLTDFKHSHNTYNSQHTCIHKA